MDNLLGAAFIAALLIVPMLVVATLPFPERPPPCDSRLQIMTIEACEGLRKDLAEKLR